MFKQKKSKKYIKFTVPVEKEDTKIDKNGEKPTKNMSNILQLIDSGKFKVTLMQI